MRKKSIVAVMVFALAFATLGGISTAEEAPVPGDSIEAIAGQSHVAVQGTNWVAERPARFLRWRPYAWGVMTRAKAAGQQWVHIAVPTTTYIDDSALSVFHVEFCATATQPTKTAPVAVHLWADDTRIYTESIVWPDTTSEYCHQIDFAPATWFESVGISVLVNYANDRNKVTLNKAWIALIP
jgi:hypothetical protein